MPKVVLKGTESGYNLIIPESLGFDKVVPEIKDLLDKIHMAKPRGLKKAPSKIKLDVQTGNRLLNVTEKEQLANVLDKYDNFEVDNISSNVVPATKLDQAIDDNNELVKVSGETVRNGQELNVDGDLVFLGHVNEGGKLTATGNIYCMGLIKGIVHAGFPNDEGKLVVGDLTQAQQVRIGEQFDIINSRNLQPYKNNTKNSDQLLSYVNELHVLRHSSLNNLKEINPKFYNRIGGK